MLTKLNCIDYAEKLKKKCQNKKNLKIHITSTSKLNPEEFFVCVRNKKVLIPSIDQIATVNGESMNDDKEICKI